MRPPRLWMPPTAREWRAFVALTRVEALLAMRRLENLLVTFGLPLLLLGVLAAVPLGPVGGTEGLQDLVPAVLTAALMATGLVSLAIATAFERGYGVLKRLAASPAPTWAIVLSRITVVAAIVVLQVLVLGLAAAAIDWRPVGGLVAALGAALPWALLGVICFSAAGLLLAVSLRPEFVLAAANGLYLVFLLLGGVLIPAERLPTIVAAVAGLLPPGLVGGLLREAMAGRPVDPLRAAALATWTAFFAAAAVSRFRAAE